MPSAYLLAKARGLSANRARKYCEDQGLRA